MKRCPHCDFLYEDDQNLCDMDGMELIHAPGLFQAEESATKPAANPRAKSRLVNLAVILVGAFLLLAVVTVLYSVLGSRAHLSSSQTSVEEAANLESETSEISGFDDSPVEDELTAAQPEENTSDTNVEKSSPGPARPQSNKRQDKRANQTPMNTKKGSKNQDKDSKVESVLKKAGRIFKKPFE